MNIKTLRIISGLAIVIAIVSGINLYQHTTKPTIQNLSMTKLQTPRAISAFKMEEYQHPIFNNASLLDHWTLAFFGFSRCPQLCPTTLAELNHVYQLLQQKNLTPLPQVLLISIDPERDSAKTIDDYAKGFNPNFIGVRPDKNQLDILSKELGIAYFKATNKGDKNYTINHSGAILLFNPKGQLAGFFTTPHTAEAIANDLVVMTQG